MPELHQCVDCAHWKPCLNLFGGPTGHGGCRFSIARNRKGDKLRECDKYQEDKGLGETKTILKNPYPQNIEDEASGVSNDEHRTWQEGYEAGWSEAKGIVQKVNAEAGDLRVFERMILAAFVSPEERRDHV